MATLSERLIEAEDAYHRLMTGTSAVEIRDSNGEMVRYTPANAYRLSAYIESLKGQIAASANNTPLYSGPMRVFL
jgi:gpW